MELSLLTAVFVLLVSAVRADPSSDHEMRQAHEHHLSVIKSFHCLHPQPRALRIKDLLSQDQDMAHGKVYSPELTVLHRCDDECGVCSSGLTCGRLQSSFVRLQFQVTFQDEHGLHKKGSWDWEDHDVLNHTACTCIPIGHEGSVFPDHHSPRHSVTHWSEKPVNHGTTGHVNQGTAGHYGHGTADHVNQGTAGHYGHGTAGHVNQGTAGHYGHGTAEHVNHGTAGHYGHGTRY